MQDMLQLLRPRLTVIRLGAGKEKAPPPRRDAGHLQGSQRPGACSGAAGLAHPSTGDRWCRLQCWLRVTGCTLLPAPIWLDAGTGTAQ